MGGKRQNFVCLLVPSAHFSVLDLWGLTMAAGG